MASMRDVAAAAGVSVSTVAAVINNNKYVSPDLAKRVNEAIKATKYVRPDQLAAVAEAAQRDKMVAVILPGVYSSFFPPLLNGITDMASSKDIPVLLMDSKRSFSREKELMERAASYGIRQFILDSVCDIRNEEAYFGSIRKEYIEERGARVVVVERSVRDDAFSCVSVDNYAAAYQAAEHLIELGCRHPAHISGASQFPHAKIREEAFCQCLRDHGVEIDRRRILRGDFTPLSGFSSIHFLLENGIEVDGVFAANDQMAIGAMKALLSSGLRIPDDCAVVGFDDLPVSSLVTPSLSTIHYPVYQMGYRAMEMLSAPREAGRPDSCKLDCRLVKRNSTIKNGPFDWELLGW